MVICADTSFLFALYGNDGHAAKAVTWLQAQSRPVTVSVLNEFELANALRSAECRAVLARGEAALFLAQFEADLASGRLSRQVCNLSEVIDEAKRLSATHTLAAGHRGFDILHVAVALQLEAGLFLTFDSNQRKLAGFEGLTVPL